MALERLWQGIPVLFDLWQRLIHTYALGTVPDKALSWCKHERTAVYLLRGLLDCRPVV